ncbi:MAG: PilZ domain-containing protein [Phycisphaerales bacterium]
MSRAVHNAPLVLGPSRGSKNDRKFGRVLCERIGCELEGCEGVVRDLSAGGARLQFRSRPPCREGEAASIVITSSTAPPLSISVRVIWRKKRGFRRHEIGVSFGEPTAATRAALGQVMRTSSVTNTVYRERID